MTVITIRAVRPEVRDALSREARERGQSLQAYLLGVLERQAAFGRNRSILAEAEADLADGGGAGRDAEDAAVVIERARPERVDDDGGVSGAAGDAA